MMRIAIAAIAKDFLKIIGDRKFKARFGELDGDRLSKPPKGFDADHPAIEYLKLKSFTVSEEFSAKDAVSKDYPKLLAESFKAAYPLVTFLRDALK
jgi:uncharacterized protein (DUF2461 family)